MMSLLVVIDLGDVVSIEENKRADTDRQLVDVSYAVSASGGLTETQRQRHSDMQSMLTCPN